jgi:hypothetical protein
MNQDRQMIAEAVLDGVLGPEYLTDHELAEIEILVQEFCMQREMDSAAERGCSVFDGVEGGDLIH